MLPASSGPGALPRGRANPAPGARPRAGTAGRPRRRSPMARVAPGHRANVRTAAKSATRAVGDGRTMMRRWWLIGAACALTLGRAPAIAGSQALAAAAPGNGARINAAGELGT